MYGKQNKWCFVPECPSTSVSTPNKLFVTVPKNASRKAKWMKAAGRDFPKSKSIFFCCQDHFNFEEDMDNYIRHKLMGGPIILKSHVVPHIFNIQLDTKKAASVPLRWLSLKRLRKRLVEAQEKALRNEIQTSYDLNKSSTNTRIYLIGQIHTTATEHIKVKKDQAKIEFNEIKHFCNTTISVEPALNVKVEAENDFKINLNIKQKFHEDITLFNLKQEEIYIKDEPLM